MNTTITTQKDFIVAEQMPGQYKLHIFESQEQFKNWRAEHTGSFVHRSNVRGRMLPAEDHRNEFEYM